MFKKLLAKVTTVLHVPSLTPRSSTTTKDNRNSITAPQAGEDATPRASTSSGTKREKRLLKEQAKREKREERERRKQQKNAKKGKRKDGGGNGEERESAVVSDVAPPVSATQAPVETARPPTRRLSKQLQRKGSASPIKTGPGPQNTGAVGGMVAASPPRPKYNIADYTFSKLHNEVVAKVPGDIPSGFPFAIEDCEDSNIFIFDVTSQVTVDACKRCFIVIGPCEGSVFIRDCEECVFVVACRQFRVADSRQLRISLYSATQPVIENSKLIAFSCFRYGYKQLGDQFALANLPTLLNEWSDVYDFTASKGKNWALDSPLANEEYRPPPPPAQSLVHVSLDNTDVVPCTLGNLPRNQAGSMVFISFLPDPTTADILRRLKQKVTIVRIRERKYTPPDINLLFSHLEDGQLLKMAKGKDRCIAAELEGTETNALLILESSRPPLGDAMDLLYFSRNREAAKKELRVFFGGSGK